jgi:NAD(P)-dependent dehydrogenase (short-subunit alcohol dehydrogenase family)
MDRLKDKVVFISGAGAGIGRATAILFAKEDAKVIIAEIDESGGQETARMIAKNGGQGIYIKTDVTNEPIDVSYTKLFLASDESKRVTGAIFSIDSGVVALGRISP